MKLLLLLAFQALTPQPPLPVMHVTVERFKTGAPSVFEFDDSARLVGVAYEPVGFRVRVWQIVGPPQDFRFFAPGEKARIEIENK